MCAKSDLPKQDMAFLGSAAKQRLMAIVSAFDLNGAPIEKWSSSTSLVREKAPGSNPGVGSNFNDLILNAASTYQL